MNPDMVEKDEETIKLEINNLLWVFLPSKISLGDAEKIACRIFDLIWDERTENA